jgi:(1->4)-alpha-D-glucan 1-alpha-D-glucosylmutase
MPTVKLLDRLCALHGIETERKDCRGDTVRVSADTKKALLAALGLAVGHPARFSEWLDRSSRREWLRVLPPVKVMRADGRPGTLELTLPPPFEQAAVDWSLVLENGQRREGRVRPADLPLLAERDIGECCHRRYRLTLPDATPQGYHRFALACAEPELRAEMSLIVVPESCFTAPVLEEREKIWGLALPLYAVRSQRNWGIGDFTDLRTLVEYAADRGAALVRLSPLTATFPRSPRCNPYEPATRLFFNPLYLDLEAIPDFSESAAAQQAVAEPEFQARLRALRAEELVDFAEVAEIKLGIAELLFEHFRYSHLAADSARAGEFRAYRDSQGAALAQQTLFDAIAEQFLPERPNWAEWPDDYRDPASGAVRAFADRHADRLDYFAYLYWQADRQLHAAGYRSLEIGLPVGLCQDFVFTAAHGGSETWAGQPWHAGAARLGAPPTPSRPEGEVRAAAPYNPWALRETGYAPFIAALRQNMRHAGALLIHGVGDLARQYWIPADGGAEEGAFVEFPAEDLLGILALESRRNRCMVLAFDEALSEDLCEKLEALGALPYRSFFLDARDGRDISGQDLPGCVAVAAAATDEPTLRGFWLGRDLDEKAALKLYASETARHEEVVARALARVRLLVALDREGLLPAEVTLHPVSIPDMTPELVRAVYLYLCRSPAKVLLVRMEDALGQAEPVALPGAPADYPNWRRKLPLELEQWRKEDAVADLLDAVAQCRAGALRPQPKPRPAAGGVRFVVPRATYRLQFNRQFTFRDAAELLPYLHDLGISHCYASPYLKARPGSTHGYDIVDHGAVNPEVGGPEDFEHFVRELARRGMGQILDLVPNHMGIMGSDNAWWLDVLENGEAAVHAPYFDIDWSPVKDYLRGKVLLPTLGSPYGTALENGEIELVFDSEEGSFSCWYGPHRFPIDPREYPRILGYRLDQLETAVSPDDPHLPEFQSLVTALGHLPGRWQTGDQKRAERNRDKEIHKRHLARLCADSRDIARFIARNLAEFNGTPGVPSSFDRLHDLLEHQAYRLAYWRVAADEINYRRFFDTNDLAALSMENEEVFRATHPFVLDLISEGKLHGLRIDHPDGLYDPETYFRRLQDGVAALARPQPSPATPRFYIVAEKILEAGENLPIQWPVQGTTGYDFANLVNGLFVWSGAEPALDAFYREFSGHRTDFGELLYESKRLIMKVALSSELTVLANRLSRIAESDRRTRDYSLTGLRDALREIIACFPVYRTYVTGAGASERDAAYIDQAVTEAKRRSPAGDLSVFDFIRDLLRVQTEGKPDRYREQVISFAMKFQQVTGPVMAKGMEDTAFYRYHRLLSLNEVGGDPRRFGVSLDDFHRCKQTYAATWPHSLLSTSTHDTKRSEDVRARLDVLSEVPEEWIAAVRRWSDMNRRRKTRVDGEPAPTGNDEYLIYQTLFGTWPLDEPDRAAMADYGARLEAYLRKALREAKRHSSWINPNLPYEEATFKFLSGLLDGTGRNRFLADFTAFTAGLVRHGLYNSLFQLLLKLTVPGVPDIYQGNELWDFSLVDPDNRRPVDYPLRRNLLHDLKALDGLGPDKLAPRLADMEARMEDGRIKLHVTREALRLRRQFPDLFGQGDYQPLSVVGAKAEHLCAFLRRHGSRVLLVAVPRWTRRLAGGSEASPGRAELWEDTAILLPPRVSGVYFNGYTRERLNLNGTAPVPAGRLFGKFPLGLMVKAG